MQNLRKFPKCIFYSCMLLENDVAQKFFCKKEIHKIFLYHKKISKFLIKLNYRKQNFKTIIKNSYFHFFKNLYERKNRNFPENIQNFENKL